MFEKVNPKHPDKVADRIAGAIVDIAYRKNENSKCAVEVLIGHRTCSVLIESSEDFSDKEIESVVRRIAGDNTTLNLLVVQQDANLANNQTGHIRCGDNGIFKGAVVSEEEKELSRIARYLYGLYNSDGKYILADGRLIICQSKASTDAILEDFPGAEVNPLGYWTGGTDVDCGATNRKLGSDMARSVTGGGLHGKDLSKADVSVNIYAHLKAQQLGRDVEMCCAIGDETVDGVPYEEIVKIAKDYINSIGGFEKFAEWGLL